MPAAVERLLAAHAAGEAEGGDAVWSLLNLELWYRTFIDGDGVQTLPGKPLRDPRRRIAGAEGHGMSDPLAERRTCCCRSTRAASCARGT